MPKVQKPGFTYGYSDELQLEWAVNDKTGTLTTEDGVHYSTAEQQLLYRKYGVIPGNIHAIKKVFKGTLIDEANIRLSVPVKTGRTDRAAEPGNAKNQNAGKPVQKTAEPLPAEQRGLFDIY